VLCCFDRIVITGTLPEIARAEAMARYLGVRGMCLFDYPRSAEPLREELRSHAERLAAEACLESEFIRHYKAFRKEERGKATLAARGEHRCISFRRWRPVLCIAPGMTSYSIRSVGSPPRARPTSSPSSWDANLPRPSAGRRIMIFTYMDPSLRVRWFTAMMLAAYRSYGQ
jgi:hypothetical protein